MRCVSRRALTLPVRGSVRGSVCVGNSSGPVCFVLRCGASSEGPLHLLRLQGDRGYWRVRQLTGWRWGDDRGRSARYCPSLGLTHRVHVDGGWLRKSACLRACDSAAVQLLPNHRISHKLNQHPQTRVLRCGELYPEYHQLGLFFFLRLPFL